MPASEVRARAGLVVLNEQQRVLLFLHADGYGREFWATPGGGVETGETVEQAAHREAAEELGANQAELTLLWTGHSDFLFADRQVSQDETYFLVVCRPEMLGSQVIDLHRREGIQEVRWWSLEDIAMAESSVFPVDLAERLRDFFNMGQP